MNAEQEIAELVADIREGMQLMEQLDERLQASKDRLRVLLIQHGDWKDEQGHARIRGDIIRTSYDQKGLDQLIIANPLKNGWLKDYRREFIIQSTVEVK